MHRALFISEIANFICEPLDETTLAALARSCKALHEPAVHSLWADLSNLVPLVKCFPDDSWTVEDNEIVRKSHTRLFAGTDSGYTILIGPTSPPPTP